jgi:hypothetical protein
MVSGELNPDKISSDATEAQLTSGYAEADTRRTRRRLYAGDGQTEAAFDNLLSATVCGSPAR